MLYIVKQYTKDGSVYRPLIVWKAVVIRCVLGLAAAAALSIPAWYFIKIHDLEEPAARWLRFVGYIYFLPDDGILLRLFMLMLTVIMAVRLKHILIFAVCLYQRYAPESTRSACRFTPSCSQYMIMAVEKYGAVIGFVKGMNRLSRCHAPNGGYDYP